jgi:hypothetical protein
MRRRRRGVVPGLPSHMRQHVYNYGRRHGSLARPARSTRSLFVDRLPDGRWAQWWARDWYVVDRQVWRREARPYGKAPRWTRLDPATGVVMV